MLKDKRIRIIIGHYGSGKTEFAVNYAFKLAEKKLDKSIAIADLDIVNPYFRSREQANTFEEKGIEILSSARGNKYDNADIPMVSAGILKLFQNEDYESIIDVGGNAEGARPLVRYKAELKKTNYDMFAVINTNRRQTSSVEGAIEHIKAIESVTGIKVTGLINNTHMLRETTVDDVLKGQKIVKEVSQSLNIPIKYISVLEKLVKPLEDKNLEGEIFPIKMYMRKDWM